MKLNIDPEKLDREQLIGLINILSRGKEADKVSTQQPKTKITDRRGLWNKKRTPEIDEFLLQNYNNFSLHNLSMEVFKRFGVSIDKSTIRDFIGRAGLKKSRHAEFKKERMRKAYGSFRNNEVVKKFILENYDKYSCSELAALVKEKYGLDVVKSTISTFLVGSGIKKPKIYSKKVISKSVKVSKRKEVPNSVIAFIVRRMNEGTSQEVAEWVKKELDYDINGARINYLIAKMGLVKKRVLSKSRIDAQIEKYRMVATKKCFGHGCENIVRRKPEWTDRQWAYIKMCPDCFGRVLGRKKGSSGFLPSPSFDWIQTFGESGFVIKSIVADCLARKQKIQPEDFLSLMSRREFINDLSVKILAGWKGILKDLGLEGKTLAMIEETIYLR